MPLTHPECVALLRACRAHPLDDTPRLVLADWLDEHDQSEFAEFIRLQCELAYPSENHDRLQQLRQRESELLLAHWAEWTGELPFLVRRLEQARYIAYQLLTGRSVNPAELPESLQTQAISPLSSQNPWRFSRGLLTLHLRYEELTSRSMQEWLGKPEAELLMSIQTDTQDEKSLPHLRVPGAIVPFVALNCLLVLTGSPARLTALSCENFKLVRHLTVRVEKAHPGQAQKMLKGDFRQIQKLTLAGRGLTSEFCSQLLAHGWQNLARLEFDRTSLPTNFWQSLFASERFPNLLELVAFRNPLGDAGALALAKTHARQLSHIELMNCQIGDAGFIALLEAGLLQRLAGPQFNFSMNQVGDAGAIALANQPEIGRFSEIVLRENQIGDTGATALARSPHLRHVTYLDLWKNEITDAGVEGFLTVKNWSHLQALNLRDNPISHTAENELRHCFGDRVKV